MKNIIAFFCVLIFISCSNTTNTSSEKEFHTLIDQWHLAAAEADYESYFGFIAEEGVFIGTDVTERWNKSEFSDFSKPYFDQGKAWSFIAKERTIRLNKEQTIVWFDEVLDTWMGDCRATGVLQLSEGEWKLEHYQLSVTIANELMPQFLEITKSE